MCDMRLDLLPPGIKISGVIVKEFNGHRLYIGGDLKRFETISECFKKVHEGKMVFEPIGEVNAIPKVIQAIIRALNRLEGLHGVQSGTKDINKLVLLKPEAQEVVAAQV